MGLIARDGGPPVVRSAEGGTTVDLVGLVHWLIDRVIWAWRHSLRGVRPFAVLCLLAATAGTLAWGYLVVAEGTDEWLGAVFGIVVIGAILFLPGVLMALLWQRGNEAMAAGERLKVDIATLVQSPQGVNEKAVLDSLRKQVEGKGTWRGSRIAAKGLSKLVWEHKGAIWNGKEAAELLRPPGPLTLAFGFLGGAILLVVTPILVAVAVGFAAT